MSTLAHPADLALADDVLREHDPDAQRVLLWLRGERDERRQEWLRVNGHLLARTDLSDGVQVVPVRVTPFRQDFRTDFRRLFDRFWSRERLQGGRYILPTGDWVEPDGPSRGDALLAWGTAADAALDGERAAARWPVNQGWRQLGPNLVLVLGVDPPVPLPRPAAPPKPAASAPAPAANGNGAPTAHVSDAELQRRLEERSRYVRDLARGGMQQQALKEARELLEEVRTQRGPTHPWVATCLLLIAHTHQIHGEDTPAESLYREALGIPCPILGDNHPNFSTGLNNLAVLYQNRGQYADAEPLHQQALQVRRTALQEMHPLVAASMSNLGLLYQARADTTAAEPLLLRALEIFQATLGDAHPDVATCMDNVAAFYEGLGDGPTARTLAEQARQVRRAAEGKEQVLLADTLNVLAAAKPVETATVEERGATDTPTVEESCPLTWLPATGPADAYWEQSAAPESPAQAVSATRAGAEDEVAAAVATTAPSPAPEPPTVADAGAVPTAPTEPFASPAAPEDTTPVISGVAVGPPDVAPEVAEVVPPAGEPAAESEATESGSTVASALSQADEGQEAGEALTVPEAQASAAPVDPAPPWGEELAEEVSPEPSLILEQDETDPPGTGLLLDEHDAEPPPVTASSAVEPPAEIEPPGSSSAVAAALSPVDEGQGLEAGEVWSARETQAGAVTVDPAPRGGEERTEEISLEPFPILAEEKSDALDTGLLLDDDDAEPPPPATDSLASDSARTVQEPPTAPTVIESPPAPADEVVVALRTPESEPAPAPVPRPAAPLVVGPTVEVPEARADGAPDEVPPDDPAGLRGKALDHAAAGRTAESIRLLRRLLPSELHPDPDDLDLFLSLLHEHAVPAAARSGLDLVLRQRAARFAAGEVPEAAAREIAQSLPAGSALVEFVYLRPFNLGGASPGTDRPPARYLAFVLPAGEPDRTALVDLGEAAEIDQRIADFRAWVTGEQGGDRVVPVRRPPDGGDTVSPAATALRAAVLDPLAASLGGRSHLFLAPAGDLARVPFEALSQADGRPLMETNHLCYVDSGLDVLHFGAEPDEQPGAPVVAADPDVDVYLAGPASGAAGCRLAPAPDAPRFERLTATRRAARHFAAQLGVEPWLAGTVSRARLLGLHAPRVLHLAAPCVLAGGLPGGAALAVAGANGYGPGRTPPADADPGVLTAADIAGLDLRATELVVLPACDAGAGTAPAGDGLLALHRAFLQAGAAAVVSSLWRVPDYHVKELLSDFYDRVLAGEPRAEALRQAQLVLRARYPDRPEYWGAFVCRGDPGPLHAPPAPQPRGGVGGLLAAFRRRR
jgi:CHAT domain-containing protein/tetratricopeptide (TPR) repeat protein